MPLRPYQIAAVESILNWLRFKDTPAIASIATGGGKTFLISALCDHLHKKGQRTLIVAHRKELLSQAGNVLNVPFAYYSAGLGEMRLDSPVTAANIQSIYNKDTPPYDAIIIDECHRVAPHEESQYQQLIKKNPQAKLIGVTATPFRTQGGILDWGEIVYQIGYRELYDMGFLAKVTNKAKQPPDLSGVKVTAGEYNLAALEDVMVDQEAAMEAVKHLRAYRDERKSILIFCVGVRHAELLVRLMHENQMKAAVVTGATPDPERDRIANDFKGGKIQYLVNVMIFTEGFDAPNVDMIVCLRPTMSKGLWTQIMGRGCRKAEGKVDCLLLDFSGNLQKHGGLDTPYKEPARGEVRKENYRVCPECEDVSPVGSKECVNCGYIFIKEEPRKANHEAAPDTESDTVYQPLQDFTVTDVKYGEHLNRKKGTKSIKVSYHCPATKYGTISEWLAVWSASDYARNKATIWFKERGWDVYGDIKDYDAEAILFHCKDLKKPARITVDYNGDFPRVVKYEWRKESEEAEEGRTGNTAGVNPVDLAALLGGDEIPY